jgi:hypothetical protein
MCAVEQWLDGTIGIQEFTDLTKCSRTSALLDDRPRVPSAPLKAARLIPIVCPTAKNARIMCREKCHAPFPSDRPTAYDDV